ncbi:lysine N(6)-hydroxylase/L-ornithine N(5)-oxygenase family protein [Epibacterium mobile]|nr:lysine N(6)-hydroxylase/L-ornithine N(5)-oxygenase family protein [Tritonibacter mobilis]NHM24133.1 lysine N(6)-hydroxylase/L-ornithine N(5)-oxygenase family protein [Tritonibacter mobilis]
MNRKTFFPSRHEFNDYFTWAAEQMQDVCAYDQRVEAVAPVQGSGGTVELLDVVTTDASGRESRRRTKDLVLAIGGAPNIPEVFANLRRHSAVLHSSSYVTQCKPKLASAEHPLRIAVIGSGQSGAEIFWDLVNDPAQPNVDLIFRGQALKPSDDSPFVNEIFDLCFYQRHVQPPQGRARGLSDGIRPHQLCRGRRRSDRPDLWRVL